MENLGAPRPEIKGGSLLRRPAKADASSRKVRKKV
jgi:hypothetical protein